MKTVIYGAQGIALGAYNSIKELCPSCEILCFLVTKMGMNASSLGGIPVRELEEFASEYSQEDKDSIQVLIATPENVMPEIESALEEQGFHCYVRLTSERYALLCNYSHAHDKEYISLSTLPVGYHCSKLHVFMAKHCKDKPIGEEYSLPDWIIPIQVGAALCDARITTVLDCEGDNISDRNGNYSELTALYWIWKNCLNDTKAGDDREYYGLCHYRRYLELSEDDVLRLADNGVDVVLPFPMPYEPDIEEHHKRYLKESDWNALLMALEELQPEYAGRFPDILRQRYLYNYNILIARKHVLCDYCEWLFPILARTEELSNPRGSERKDRYIGYMGETLTTLYFMVHKDKLNITHAGCKFMV